MAGPTAPQVDSDDCVPGLTAWNRMVFSHSDPLPAGSVDEPVGVSPAVVGIGWILVGRSNWNRVRPGVLTIQPLVCERRVIGGSTIDRGRPSAILVRSSADVEMPRGHVFCVPI